MGQPEDPLEGLIDALKLSPENLPLRQHLAESLLNVGRPQEAEEQFREALARSPGDARLKLGLAKAFYQQGKNGQALALVESLDQGNPSAALLILYARLLLRTGETQRAAQQYRKAIDLEPALADDDLSDRLGVYPKASSSATAADSGMLVDGRLRAAWAEPAEATGISVERPTIRFVDVGGMEKLKDEIRMKIVLPLTHPELYKAYGKSTGGGILMFGPPGCGKTYLARATAGEINAGFIAVGLSDILDMWIGQSERNLHALFDQARQARPCVLFFDEVDALGASRADMRRSAGRTLINQFLAEMDGVQDSNEGVLILAATNAPWHLDSAFRRPGRFDRVLFVEPPDSAARAEILRICCRGKPVADIDYDHVAKKTEAFSGADLSGVVDQAVEAKLREALRAGVPKPLNTRDLTSAAAAAHPTTREWFATARNYALYSNQGGVYDDVLKYLKLR